METKQQREVEALSNFANNSMNHFLLGWDRCIKTFNK